MGAFQGQEENLYKRVKFKCKSQIWIKTKNSKSLKKSESKCFTLNHNDDLIDALDYILIIEHKFIADHQLKFVKRM